MPKSYFERFRIIVVLLVMDAISIAVSFLASMWIKFDFQINIVPDEYVNEFMSLIWIWILVYPKLWYVHKWYH